MNKFYPDSGVEIQGFAAKFYDSMLNILSFGSYSSFIKKAIRSMNINENDEILDLGAGTGRNALLMNQYISDKGEILGLEISELMIAQFKIVECKYAFEYVERDWKQILSEFGFRDFQEKLSLGKHIRLLKAKKSK